MPKPLELVWNRCRGDAWCELFAVDLAGPHFNGLQGVYVLWHAGAQPETVCLGQGLIRERITMLRGDPAVLAFKDLGLYVTWARVERAVSDGVERFLAESLQPRIKVGVPNVMPVECTIPGRAAAASPPAAAPAAAGGDSILPMVSMLPAGNAVPDYTTQPGQIYENLVLNPGEAPQSLNARDVSIIAPPKAVPAPPPVAAKPKVKYVSNLQKHFNELVQHAAAQPQDKRFFGSGGQPRATEDTLVVDAVKLILEEAARMQSSDIHLEPRETYLRVRFRIDGILEEVLEIPKGANIRAVSHVRVRCGLDPEQALNTGKPQDGRMSMVVDGQEVDLRLSTFPTAFGDKAVLRIIAHNIKVPTLAELGLRPKITEQMSELIHRPQGMMVVTGPAGSGKSTTLYTILQTLNTPTRNIVTLEDPVEHTIPGITQGALQPRMGFTFAEGLRSILRQDPNVIMVGEIRDKETAEIAMSAALTGHLLFTTLHTTSALGAVTRLLDMGLEPFLISSALTAICAQRLARRLCPHCRDAYVPSPAELAQVKAMTERADIPLPASITQQLYRSKGCSSCRDTGYQGRVLILEVVTISIALGQLILRKASMDELRKNAAAEGTVTLLMDGLDKVAQGLTTMGELVRVVG